jgi:hypothetical protein
MKNSLTILFLFLINFLNAQVESDTVFTENQVIRIYTYIDSLEKELNVLHKKYELSNLLIEQYKNNSKELNDLVLFNDRYLKIRDDQFKIMEQNVKVYQEYFNNIKKPFFEKPIVWFFLGVGTIYTSSKIISNIK